MTPQKIISCGINSLAILQRELKQPRETDATQQHFEEKSARAMFASKDLRSVVSRASLREEKQGVLSQGAEAIIILNKNQIIKQRISKSYRISELDEKIRKLRTRNEGKLLEKAGKIISIPKVLKTEEQKKEITMEFIKGEKLSENLDNFDLKKQLEICKKIGLEISKLHEQGIIHGDLTTSNMIYVEDKSCEDKNSAKVNPNEKTPSTLTKSCELKEFASDCKERDSGRVGGNTSKISKFNIFFIDFGLGYQDGKYEDKAVDLHVLKQALEAKHFTNWENLWKEIEKSYLSFNTGESKKVLERLKAVEKRGRYKH